VTYGHIALQGDFKDGLLDGRGIIFQTEENNSQIILQQGKFEKGVAISEHEILFDDLPLFDFAKFESNLDFSRSPFLDDLLTKMN
jgi:hypothetical protein